MKPKSVKAIIVAITVLSLLGIAYPNITKETKEKYTSTNSTIISTNITKLENNQYIPTARIETANIETVQTPSVEVLPTLTIAKAQTQKELDQEQIEEKKKEIVYDGMTLEQLSEKLNRSLNSTISGQGYTFASYSVELGIDPYLAVAIVMHETGCQWQCSSLMQLCNNVGGMRGGGTGQCNGGSYASFPSLQDGIKAFMNNLYKNYFSQGLTTPETIGPKYAASTTWPTQVRSYMEKVKKS